MPNKIRLSHQQVPTLHIPRMSLLGLALAALLGLASSAAALAAPDTTAADEKSTYSATPT